MNLVEFVEQLDSVDRSIVVVNRTEPQPIQNMLVETFSDDSVEIKERGDAEIEVGSETQPNRLSETSSPRIEALVGADALSETTESADVDLDDFVDDDAVPFDRTSIEDVENLVLLVEGGDVVASSTLEELINAILLVNSDLYITGTRDIDELDLPGVLTGLEDTVFTLKGYPESNKQKLLLITISRFIERVAWEAGEGTLRSSFQRLSRLDDEVGTRQVYKKVSDAGVDTHLYGVPDEIPSELDSVIHAGNSIDFTDTWFVVYRPPEGPKRIDADDDLQRGIDGGVALLAVEVEPRLWRGVWTFDPDRIDRINGYIERNL